MKFCKNVREMSVKCTFQPDESVMFGPDVSVWENSSFCVYSLESFCQWESNYVPPPWGRWGTYCF